MSLWAIPSHVRPVVSFDKIKKGRMERPRNGLDRFILTEVGEYVMRSFMKTGLKMAVRRANPPFPWQMGFRENGMEVANLNAYSIGPSTFRSIFHFQFIGNTGGEQLMEGLVTSLEGPPLESRYWNDDTWSSFTRLTGHSKNEIMTKNRMVLERL